MAIEIVLEDCFLSLQNLDCKADEEALRARDESALIFALEEDVARVEVAQPHRPTALRAVRQKDAGALIEIKPYARGGFLRRNGSGRRISRLRRRPRM